jgi:outer membrane protein
MMKTNTLAIAGAAAIAALGGASMAFAQAKAPAKAPAKPAVSTAAAPATPPVALTGTGVCVLSREGLLAGSTVGKYVQTRIGQLNNQVQAELSGEGNSIQTAAKDLETKKATLAQAAYQQQGQALQQRVNALQEKAQQRDRELQATEQKAVQKILQEATPLVAAQAQSKNCGVLLDGGAVLAVNTAMDLTPGVITALNGKLTQFDFDREHLDAQPAAQQR